MVTWRDTYRSVVLGLLIGQLLLVLVYAFTRTWFKASLICSVSLLAFYSYASVRDGLCYGLPKHELFCMHRYVLPLVGFVVLASSVLIWRGLSKVQPVHEAALVISAVLVLWPVARIVTGGGNSLVKSSGGLAGLDLTLSKPDPAPDVYYIILDSYARSDVLAKMGYDNRQFTDFLLAKGFYIAEASASNYGTTIESLSSSLNLDYLPTGGERISFQEMAHLIDHSRVTEALKGLGYTTVAFSTGYDFADMADADLFWAPYGILPRLNEFESALLDTTALRSLGENSRMDRVRNLYALGRLHEPAQLPGEYFVFALITATHAPYVFSPDGEPVDETALGVTGYLHQIEFVNRRLMTVIDQILTESETPPVIILQADHGHRILEAASLTSEEDRDHAILSAYYLPGACGELDRPAISPVNNFRLLFSRCFGADLPLLEDRIVQAGGATGKARDS